MTFDRPASSSGRRSSAAAAHLQRMLGQCSEILQRELPPLVDRALQRVDDTLYEFADKAESDRGYYTHFDAQRRLRRERASLKRRFLRNLTDTIALFQDAARTLDMASEHRLDSEDLELLGDRDLEESLVLSNMISKAESRYANPLRDLTRHFAQLLGRATLRQRDMPVGPTAIATAFAAALRSIDELDVSTVLVVHKIFDQQVMDHLEGFYTGCIDFAETQGLVPSSRRHHIVKTPDGRDTTRGAASSAAPRQTKGVAAAVDPAQGATSAPQLSGKSVALKTQAESAVGSGSGAASQMTFDALRQMLSSTRHSSPSAPTQQTLATDELIALLSRVQPEAARQSAEITLQPSALRDTVGNRLQASMDPTQPRRLAPNDEDTMDLVFLLFEQLLVGTVIPDAIKVLVSRLQIPYVKVALVDRSFFDDPTHPARRLLNRIADASIGWNEVDRDQDGGLYARIEAVVERVVTEMQTEPQLFEALDREFEQQMLAQGRNALAAEQRTIRQVAARSARQGARLQALALIDARAPQREGLPAVVQTILRDGWVEAMVQAHAEAGEQSRAWRNGERLLDDLLWSVAPKRDPSERRELLRRIPELLRSLRVSLSTVVSDQQQLARWLKDLQTVHIAALRGQPAADADARMPKAPAAVAEPSAASASEADALPIGSWLGIVRDDGSLHRFKLAWRGDAGDPLLFVDRDGRKGFELPRPELEALLAQDLATVIGTGHPPLVDRAMEAVGHSLSIH